MGKSERSMKAPTRYIPIGSVFRVAGVEYVVVPNKARMPFDACRGCFFSGKENGKFRTCPAVQCSCFERVDGKSVWFIPLEK